MERRAIGVRAMILMGLLGACKSTAGEIRPSAATQVTADGNATEPVLYARDGSVVAGDPPGSITATGEPTRDIASHAGSRMYLLDLYQKAMDEKDALSLEVKGLDATLAREQGQIDALTKERDALSAQLHELQEENQRVTAENADLAARLTTAQIRRLEAEKLLLEARIEWQRAQDAETNPNRKGRTPAASPKDPNAASAHPLKRALENETPQKTSPTDEHGQEGHP